MAIKTDKKDKIGSMKDRKKVINTQTGLYVKQEHGTTMHVIDSKSQNVNKGITKDEINKMAPSLKRLAEYDKKGAQK